MRFRLYREHGALNSVPVFNAFEQGVKSLGHEIVSSNEDVAVIWSVLWYGRMAANREIYEKCIRENKPIIIIDVAKPIKKAKVTKNNTKCQFNLNFISSPLRLRQRKRIYSLLLCSQSLFISCFNSCFVLG
jgi:hypothetical protein